jgi:hypothetical protein
VVELGSRYSRCDGLSDTHWTHQATAAAAADEQQQQQQQQLELLCLLEWLAGLRTTPYPDPSSSSSSRGVCCVGVTSTLLPAVDWPAAATAATIAATAAGHSAPSTWEVLQRPRVFFDEVLEVAGSIPTPGTHQQQKQQQQQQLPAWQHLAAAGDPWVLLLEVFAACLGVMGHAVTQQQQQLGGTPGVTTTITAAAAAGSAVSIARGTWLNHPAQLLRQCVQLLAPAAVAQAAVWSVTQHMCLLPAGTLAAAQQQLQQQQQGQGAQALQQQQQVGVVLSLLNAAVALMTDHGHPATTPPSENDLQPQPAAAAAAMLCESIAAQLLPLFHRAYLLHQLLLQQPPSASLAASYSRVQAAHLTQGLVGGGPSQGLAGGNSSQGFAGSSSSKGGVWVPSMQLQLVLQELGISSSLEELLQAASAPPTAAAAAGATAAAGVGVGSSEMEAAAGPAAAAAAAGGGMHDWALPAWLSADMVYRCCSTVLQYTCPGSTAPGSTPAAMDTDQPSTAAAAAAAAGSTANAATSSSTHRPQQQQQQHVTLVTLPRRPGFMSLPLSYQDLYLSLSEVVCGACGKVPEHPAICLVTGRWVDMGLCVLIRIMQR